MRDISPVKTQGVPGTYSNFDKALQMIFFGDISAWRTARIMKIAEEDHEAERTVLVLTENDHVEHLAAKGFLVFRPNTHGLDPESDGAVIIRQLREGRSIVINANEMEQVEKNALTRELTSGLSTMTLANMTIVVESTEAFFPRRRSRGDSAGMHTMNNLLKRAKNVGAHMIFGAESPQEIALEISNSCGTPVVSSVTNSERARAVSKAVDARLSKHADEIFGIKALDPADFYLFNRYTAPRPATAQIAMDIIPSENTLLQMTIVPCRLRDQVLACGFDPRNPTNSPKLGGKKQADFEKTITAGRDDTPAKPAIAADSSTAPVVANDNAGTVKPKQVKGTKRLSPRKRIEDISTGLVMLQEAGIKNVRMMFKYARTIVTARGGRLNMPVDRRITARGIAQKLIDDGLLRDAINGGFSVRKAHSADKTTIVSGGAYAAAYYQAMLEDAELARAFHAVSTGAGVRGAKSIPSVVAMQTALANIGRMTDREQRSEAQYQFVRAAWQGYVAQNGQKQSLPLAA